MKYLLTLSLIVVCTAINAQKYYKKYSPQKVNVERKEIAEKFANEFIEKCQSKNYKPFSDYNLSAKMNSILKTTFKKNCIKFEEQFGKTSISKLQNVYLQKYSADKDPIDLFVFDIQTEKEQSKTFLNLWIYHDQNYISGLIISERNYSENLKKEKSQD